MSDRGVVAGLGSVKLMAVGDVKPSVNNPRRIPATAVAIVAESLKRFGWQQPLVVDPDGTLVVGHTRLQAALKLGLTEVPVVVADGLTEAEINAYRIADNRTADFTTWDFPLLTKQLEDLADDFSAVLALEDWQAIVSDFDAPRPDISDEVAANAGLMGFTLNVVFASKDAALAAEQALIEMAGVLDVRHPRS